MTVLTYWVGAGYKQNSMNERNYLNNTKNNPDRQNSHSQLKSNTD